MRSCARPWRSLRSPRRWPRPACTTSWRPMCVQALPGGSPHPNLGPVGGVTHALPTAGSAPAPSLKGQLRDPRGLHSRPEAFGSPPAAAQGSSRWGGDAAPVSGAFWQDSLKEVVLGVGVTGRVSPSAGCSLADRAGEPALCTGGCPARLPPAGRADPGRAGRQAQAKVSPSQPSLQEPRLGLCWARGPWKPRVLPWIPGQALQGFQDTTASLPDSAALLGAWDRAGGWRLFIKNPQTALGGWGLQEGERPHQACHSCQRGGLESPEAGRPEEWPRRPFRALGLR